MGGNGFVVYNNCVKIKIELYKFVLKALAIIFQGYKIRICSGRKISIDISLKIKKPGLAIQEPGIKKVF